jgi:hypothetical protein
MKLLARFDNPTKYDEAHGHFSSIDIQKKGSTSKIQHDCPKKIAYPNIYPFWQIMPSAIVKRVKMA